MKKYCLKHLPHWVLTDPQPAFYDCESATAVQQTAKIYAKIQELITLYNEFTKEVNRYITEFEDGIIKDFNCFQNCVIKTMNDYIETIDMKINLQDNKIENKETRITNRNLHSTAITTYKNWFENLPEEYTKNVKRLFTKNELKENLGNIESTSWENISFTKFDKEQIITKQNFSNNINIKELLNEITNNFVNENKLEKIYEKNFYWINNLSLGNILNYNKFNNLLFLENAINETKNFFDEQLKKLEK